MPMRSVPRSMRVWGLLIIGILFLAAPRAVSAQSVEVLHSFSGCAPPDPANGLCLDDDGAHPQSALVRGSDGFLYGNTSGESAGSNGTLFKVAPDGTFVRLFTFLSVGLSPQPPPPFYTPLDGNFPVGSLAYGSDGAFYGVTGVGGLYCDGTVFRIASDGSFIKLHDFLWDDGITSGCGAARGGVVEGLDGKLYGTWFGGGTSQMGIVFRLEANGSMTTLHNFSGSDGIQPNGDLMLANDGNIYGTTLNGGNAGGSCALNFGGCGTIFRISPTGVVSTVYSFDETTGAYPQGGHLIQATDGHLYGTTGYTAFRMALDGTVTLVHSFTSSDGVIPTGTLVQGADGNFFGTTQAGGASNKGTIFRLTPAGDLTVLHDFVDPTGVRPYGTAVPGGLVQASDGHFYGMRVDGGAFNLGYLFRLRLPRAQDGTLAVVEDTPTDGTLLATDPNNAPLTFSIGSNGSLGTAGITDTATGAFTYTPNADANGTDSFTFKVNNGTVDSNVATITVTIGPVNDPPVAQLGNLTTDEDTAAGGTLLASDVDSATLAYSVVTNGTKGTAAVTNAATGEFTYTPTLNANGSDSFTFKANDESLDSNVTTVSVSITPVNDAPVATNGSAATTTGTPVNGVLAATDVDSAGLTYAIVTNGLKGTAVVTNTATGAYTYTPNDATSGADTFTFKANDGSLDSNSATITVIIGGNTPPVASSGTLNTLEERSARGTLQATDPEGLPLTFSLLSNGTKGTATITNASTGRFNYVPNANVSGSDSFAFVAYDGESNSNVATMSVTITPVNDAPTAKGASYCVQAATNFFGTLKATDADGDPMIYAITKEPQRSSAKIIDATIGTFRFSPDLGVKNGTTSLTFSATDPSGLSSSAKVSFTLSIYACP